VAQAAGENIVHVRGYKKKAVKYISQSPPLPDDSLMNSLYYQLMIAVTFLVRLGWIPVSLEPFENSSFKDATTANQNMNTSAAFACGDSSDQRDQAIGSTIVLY
jgi:hypothetical protein